MSLGLVVDENGKKVRYPDRHGVWDLDEDDYLLYALLCDPVYCAELLGQDPGNRQYSGCFTVRDYQYPLFRAYEEQYAGFACARATGKALSDDELVLTPDGYVRIADLRPFDLVVGSDGKPTTVLGVYPQGERELFEVQFKDGAAVVCDGDHLWSVTCDYWQARGHGQRLLRTRDLLERKTRFRVPLHSAPVLFTPRPAPEMDPWLVGALLGDGNLTRPTMVRFASIDEDNLERVRAAIPDDSVLVHDGGCNYRIRSREYIYAMPGKKSAGRKPCRLLEWSREIGLQGKSSHDKFIPNEYLYGSPDVRLGVLRGLSDTDGSVIVTGGSVEVSSASRSLAEDVKQLVLSLGGRATIRTGPTPKADRHRVVFRFSDTTPFLLARKASLYEELLGKRQVDRHWRGIETITPLVTGRQRVYLLLLKMDCLQRRGWC